MFSGSCFFTNLVAVVVTTIAIVYAFFIWSFQYWKRRGLPHLEPSIPFGNLPNPITSKTSFGENAKMLYQQAKARGLKHCGIFIMTKPTWFVLDLELVKHVFTRDFQFFTDRGFFFNEKDDPIGKSSYIQGEPKSDYKYRDLRNLKRYRDGAHLIALGGTKWKNLRAKMTPTFTSGKMKMMFQTMVDCGLILEKYIEEDVADKQVIDIKDVLGRFSTDVIGSCAFGLDCNSFKEPNSPFRVYGKKVFQPSILDTAKAFFALTFPDLARTLGMRQIKPDISNFFTKVVEDTISYRERNNVTRNDFLQLMIEMKNKKGETAGDGKTLTMNEIVAQSFVFFIAGFETSSTTMTFALFELAMHPEIQDKVRAEIKEVLARHDDKITYDSMNELIYMNQVIDESMRKYPPLPVLTRVAVENYKVPGEDTVIEKGTMVFLPVIGVHYDEDSYENPEVFNPDRFSPENKQKRHPYAHLPFGGGPRVCIGERFGILQAKVGLTSLLKNHKISLNEKTAVPLVISPTSQITAADGGVWLNVSKL
ncbi:hypothetical protein NQ315_007348 [Exocentrus adspersus]|uniref:Cytochrome P450 n=1 Tax=Exocentrus adspersus TaxID=1586481 RepID=A0AAV8VID5_9CUCU|nr:hypothetical protein NQ315_007348 [Exocentrus adspersus]